MSAGCADLQLENELHACKERMYLTVEEKNRLDDQLGSMQSAVFTTEHQLHSVQVTAHMHCQHYDMM